MIKHFNILFSFFIFLNTYSQESNRYIIRENNLYGYMDNKGNKVIKPQFEKAENFSEGLAAVKQNGLCGYINIDGKFIIEPKYIVAKDFTHGVAKVVKLTKQQIINKKGENLLDDKFEGATEINDKYMVVVTKKNKQQIHKYGVYDLKNKKLVVDTIYMWINNLNNNLCVVFKMDKYNREYTSTLINISENKLLYPFDKLNQIDKKEEFYIVKDTSYNSYILNNEGKILFEDKSNNVYEEKSFAFHKDGVFKIGNYGFVNKEGKLLFKAEENSMLTHFINGKMEYHSSKFGRCVLDSKFKVRLKNLKNFRNGPILEKDSTYTFENGKSQVYGNNFKLVKEYNFKNIYPVNNNFYLSRDNDTVNYSLRTYKNELYFENEIDPYEIGEFINGVLKLKINDQNAYLDQFGKVLWMGNLNINEYGNYYPVKQALKLKKFTEAVVEPQIKENVHFNLENINNEISFKVSNYTDKDIDLLFINSCLNVILEAQDENRNWQKVSDKLRTIDAIDTKTLKTNSAFVFKVDSINGSFKTKIRIRYIENPNEQIFNLCNEIEASINPALFVENIYFIPED